jgi:hypothetical protein
LQKLWWLTTSNLYICCRTYENISGVSQKHICMMPFLSIGLCTYTWPQP